ncbi:MAG: PKD domain-containing protein [Bacteroidia bacterium]
MNATTVDGDAAITTYAWAGSNSFTANTEDATISSPVNANDGAYTLTITDANGCSVNSSTTVTVYQKPSITAISNDGPKCEGLNIALNATTVDGDAAISTYAWAGSNSFTANTEDATISSPVNANDGAYTLTITDANGCSVNSSTTATVYENPTPVFVITESSVIPNDDIICSSSSANFNGSSSTVGDGTSITNYSWTRNGNPIGGNSSSLNSSLAGNYTLRVTNNLGCSVTSATQTLTVNLIPAVSILVNDADQCINGAGYAGNNSFNFSSSNTSNITNYAWDLGDGIGAASGASNSTYNGYVYGDEGTYLVTLNLVDNNGCTNTTNRNVIVRPIPIVGFASSSALQQCLSGNSFTFTNSTTLSDGSSVSGTSYTWNFRNGSLGSGATPTKVFTADGHYTITLIAQTTHGCLDSFQRANYIDVWPMPNIVAGTSSTISGDPAINDGQLLCTSKVIFTNASTINEGSIVNYRWDFGDGSGFYNTSVLDDIKHEYPINTTLQWGDPGYPNIIYPISIRATSDRGCISNNTITRQIKNAPTAIISMSYPTSQCLNGNAFNFRNASLNNWPSYVNGNKWTWGNGDSNVTTIYNDYTYTSEGNYRVYLITYANTGCTDTTFMDVDVLSAPVASFTHNASCSNNVSFTNQSVHATSYSWDFGNGTSSTLANPSITYASGGSYNVKLTINGSNSCGTISSVDSETVVVGNVPNVSFTSSADNCNNRISFINSTTSPVGSATYSWTFGDGASSTLTNPTHDYASSGNVDVTLSAVSSTGCTSSITNNISATAFNSSVIDADFTINQADLCVNTVSLSNNSSNGTVSTVYEYSLDSGAFQTISSFPVVLSSLSNGTHFIIFRATDGICVSNEIKSFQLNRDVTPSFTASAQQSCNTRIGFVNSTSGTGPFTYYWDFNDGGANSSSVNPSYSFSGAGTYSVTLTAITSVGCSTSVSQNITISNPISSGPSSSFSVSSTGGCATGYNFTNTSSNANSYLWDFGDGTSSNVENPTKGYLATGTYTVTLTAYNNFGCESVSSSTITVTNLGNGPLASFTIENSGACGAGAQFSFINNSVHIGAGWIPSSHWDFGDGTTSTNTFVYGKTYSSTGYKTITLTVVNSVGCSSQYSRQLYVGTAPTASFTPSYTACTKNVSFTNTSSSGSGITYSWNFGDGSTSNLANPSIAYTNEGSYLVTLTVNNQGCIATNSQTIEVGSAPSVSFNATAASCLNNILFENTSSVDYGNLSYVWDFGDGSTSTVTSPTKAYASSGNKTVTLTATNSTGCSVSQSATVAAVAATQAPISSFSVNSTENSCTNIHAFTNTSSVSGGVASYFWDFGNGSTSTSSSPSVTYNYPGTYLVSLTVNDGVCSTTYSQNVNSSVGHSGPIVQFSTPLATQCISNNRFDFSNSTYFIGWGWVNNGYTWNFGDGTTSTSTFHYGKTYASPGTYQVTLNAVSMNGCPGSASMYVTVVDLPCSGLSVVTQDELPGEVGKQSEIKAAGSAVSGISSVNANNMNLNLYPNPNTGSFTLSMAEMAQYKDVDVQIVDMLGRAVYHQSHDLRFENSIEFKNLSIDAGKYHVILMNGNKVIGRAFFAVTGQ